MRPNNNSLVRRIRFLSSESSVKGRNQRICCPVKKPCRNIGMLSQSETDIHIAVFDPWIHTHRNLTAANVLGMLESAIRHETIS